MKRRREVLVGVGASVVGSLAGCSECGETWTAYRLSLGLDSVDWTGDGWELSVSVTAEFAFPTSAEQGFGAFDVALYGEDRSLLDYETVDGLRWGDVPDDERTESECGDRGTASVTRSFSVAALPRYVGPRFHDGHEAASLEPNATGGFAGLRALRYADADATDATKSTPRTTAEGTPDSRTTDEATSGEATATDVSGDDFEPVAVESLPWPTPKNQAVRATDSLTDLRFRTAPACASRGDVHAEADGYPSDLVVEWARPIPDGSCDRPFLESAAVEGERLSLVVGLHEAPQVRCRRCDHLGYEVLADRRDDPDEEIETVELVHLSRAGDVVERVVEPVED